MADRSLPPGSAVCVLRGGRPDEVRYQGTRCHLGGPVEDRTVWEAASLSKPVFAALVIERSLNGDIDLDAPLSIDIEALGASPDRRWGELTARHVLTHTSGLPNWRGPMTGLSASGSDVDADAEQLQFNAEPGQYGYSGEAFEVLLHALCRITGLGPTDLLERAPQVGALSDSSFIWHSDFDERAAIPHSSGGESLPKRRPLVGRAAGSLHTTLSDYLEFTLSAMEAGGGHIFRPIVKLDDTHGRSLGWATHATPKGTIAWQHGDNPGFKHIVALRDNGDGVIMFTNSDDGARAYRSLYRSVLATDLPTVRDANA